MDTELFMECEEEELEPWQQVDDSVEEDDDFDSYCDPVEDSPSPLPASDMPPSRSPSSMTSDPTALSSIQNISSSEMLPPSPSIISSSSSLTHLPAPSSVSAPPLLAQAPPLILTQTAGGTFLLPAAPGTGSAQPILLTTQSFPVQTLVNPGTPLLLNLQPGQTVQPLTLIQSPSLGHLIRPSVGVSPVLPRAQAFQTRPAPSPFNCTTQSGSTFSTVRLPTTLTIRTSPPTPVNLQLTQVSRANSLELGGSPALPSGSANGVTRTSSFSTASGSTSTVVTAPSVTSAPTLVMSVEEFYYGRFKGDLSLSKPQPLGIKTFSFTCQICSYLAENNLRLMQHMLQHSELIVGEGDERKGCRFCYRQFSSSAQLKSHQEQVHGPSASASMCCICEWAFENESAFLNHMKSNHKPGEMPYICQVCSYRSSFYSDILQHFASFHRDSRFLLCVFCLKVTRNPTTYQQHLLRHQINQAFHCNRCRLQFIFLKDKMQHKLENHGSFRQPVQLEGLPPGSKVTIRTYGKCNTSVTSAGIRLLQSPSYLIQPIHIKTELVKSPIQSSPVLSTSLQSPTKRLVSHRVYVNRTSLCDGDRLVCLECGTDASDFSAHYPTHVRCLLCPYSSCCSRAYAAHMIDHHVPRSKDHPLPLHRFPPPCPFLLRCSRCDFSPRTADQMAEHLLMNPEHHSATCRTRTYIEQDIKFCHSTNQQSSVEKEPGQNTDLPNMPWRSADSWKQPMESESKPTIIPFTQISGPRHYLSKNSDAIDFFNLLFPAELVQLITNETNAHNKTCQFMGSCQPDWVPVTTHEIKGFIGLVILMGIQNLSDPSNYWSWSHYDNSYTFYRAMSFKRFKQIAANIRMGSFATDECRGTKNPNDPLHIFRPMLEILGEAMWNAYQPNCCLTIDRALLPRLEDESCQTKGNPKTQPQLWLLCDSKSGYCHRFYIQVEEKADQGFTVVPELMKGLKEKHHQLYLAKSLTSVPLMQKLLDQGIYASCSFPPCSAILPRDLWEEGQLEKPGEFLQRQFGTLLATRWMDTKEMGCLSTNASPGDPDTVWRRSQTKPGGLDPINRPMAFRLLQENMRGVDICKQLLACNPLGGIPQDRHWRSLFWFLVNLSIVNAFIVLRESRKENPPAWVQDGLFTQVNFRKRLGNQLAKCAQKYFETIEIASSRAVRTDMADEPGKQSHRMAKISTISKRCKNCNLKNIRRESVYGCIVCKANLCKHTTCFLEYHGLSTFNKGSIDFGFIEDRISGVVEGDEGKDNMDEAMAPVEDLDISEDEKLALDQFYEKKDIKDRFNSAEQHPISHLPSATISHDQSGTILIPSKARDDFFTARQLRIALFALCDGLHQASRVFSIEAHFILEWLKAAKKHFKQIKKEQKTSTDGEDRMVAWVLSMREQQLPITETNLFHKASTLKKKGGFSDSFRISYIWAVDFMLQHQLGVKSIGRAATVARTIPGFLEAKVKSFRKFTQKMILVHRLSENTIAAMDELCLFVDLRLVQDKSRRSEALELTGSLPLVTVYMTVLADGTMLPSLVQVSRHLAERVLPEFILLEASPQSLLIEDALDLWINKIWRQQQSKQTKDCKSVLILDRHREHMADQFLTSISGSGTLPAVIPGGCSFCLQPLEVCLKPVLQRFLLLRWEKFTIEEPKELEETSPNRLQTNVAELLVDWVIEALAQLNRLSQLWKKSFHLTGLLPSRKEKQEPEQESCPNPEVIQLDLLKTLTESLMGSEVLEADRAHPLELEDENDSEEEQEDGTGQKEVEKQLTQSKKEVGEVTKKKTEVERKETEKCEQEDKTRKYSKGIEEEKQEQVINKLKKDTEEEGKHKEDRKEINKERRETRIVIGEEVGHEWKIKSRTEVVEADTETDNSPQTVNT